MSTSFKIISSLVLVSFVAACGGREQEVVFADPAPAPIVAEPSYSKY